jgi:hypothetical protein
MMPVAQMQSMIVAVFLIAMGMSARAVEPSADLVAARLDALRENLSQELTFRLGTNVLRGSYTTVWRQFEDLAIAALQDILPRRIPGLTAANFDAGQAGREKNRLADFAIRCGTNVIEISIKATSRSGNPENDLGTFREHPNRAKRFAASFTLWVRYEDAGETLRAERVFFDRTWRFVGKSTLVDGVKYRKKDGNLRPKPWSMFDSGKSYWQSEPEFEAAVKRSETYRANELVKEYLTDLSEEDQRLLHDRLHEKFEQPTKP